MRSRSSRPAAPRRLPRPLRSVGAALAAVAGLAALVGGGAFAFQPAPRERASAAVAPAAVPPAAAADTAARSGRDGGPIRFQHLGVEDGLAQGSVYSIYQDREGFMWFGTQRGLSRFDGYTFTNYETVPFDSTSYPGGVPAVLLQARDGALWVGTSVEGLARLDPRTGRFRRFSYADAPPDAPVPAGADTAALVRGQVYALHEEDDGALWIGMEGGLARFEPATGRVQRFTHRPGDAATLAATAATDLLAGPDSALWVGSRNGLSRLDLRTGALTRHLHTPEGPDGAIPPEAVPVEDLWADPRESHVVWFSGRGLTRFDTRSGEATRLLPEPSLRPTDPLNETLRIAADPRERGVLWATTRRDGLLRLDARTGRFARFRHDPADANSLRQDYAYSIHTDRSGVVWVGTMGQGLSRFDPAIVRMALYRALPGNPNSLTDPIVFSILEDREGILWVGTREGGLNRIDRRASTVRAFRHDPGYAGSLAPGAIRSLHEGRDSALWVGTREALSRFDRATGRFTHFRHDPTDAATLTAGEVQRIVEDDAGALWVAVHGSSGGLNRLDPATGRVTRYQHDPADPTSLSSSFVHVVYRDHAGAIWAGTGQGGLNRLDTRTGRFTRYKHDPRDPTTLSHPSVRSLWERAREPGVLWVGTASGLNRLDTRTGRIRHYTERDGLPDNVIYAILEDEEGRLWLSTDNGLARFDPRTGACRRYGLEAGLQGLEFNLGAAYRSPSGELFFGGPEGLNAFYPADLSDNTTPPVVLLTGLQLFNRPVRPGQGALARPLWEQRRIRLAHDQNALTFEFVALHYKQPALNRYAYRLDGFDADWVAAGTRRRATYTNLAPGTYTFRVQASNSDGVWTRTPTSLQVVIRPPWWQTWWAYALYAALAAGLLVYGLRQERARVVRRERWAARERELKHARELERAFHELDQSHRQLQAAQDRMVQQEKLAGLGRLTAGVAHEIKNPLNFVNNFASVTTERVAELRAALGARADGGDGEVAELLDEIEANAHRIEAHGQRADGIVRNMLAHSRSAPGVRRRVNLNALVDEYAGLAYHGHRAREASLDVAFTRELDPQVGEVDVAPEEIGRVLINLLGNAFDAVRARAQADGAGYRPHVTIATERIGEAVELRVRDNGSGIPEALRQRVFEPFFTTKPSGEGTGLGLSLSHDVAVAHGGALGVETADGVGTTFTLTLPVASAWPDGTGGDGARE